MNCLGADAVSADPPIFVTNVRTETRRFGSHEMSTVPGDRPAHAVIEGGLQPIAISKAMGQDAGGQWGGLATTTFGEVALALADQRFADLPERYAVDGRRVTIREAAVEVDPISGARTLPLVREMSIRAVALAETWSWSSGEMRLRLTDASAKLAVPLQQATYGGLGVTDGGPELKGVTKPLAFGRCNNVSPVLLDAFLQLYQVHDGPMRELIRVRDRGVELNPPDTAYSLDALLNASIEAGGVLAYLGMGLFRLGSPPDGIVTCDVRGDGEDLATVGPSYWDDGTGWDDGTSWIGPGEAGLRAYTSTIGGLVRRWAFMAGWASRDLDRAWTDELSRVYPEPVGRYLPAGGSASSLQLISEAVTACCGWCEVDRTGTLTGGLLRRPAGRASVRVGTDQIVDARRIDLPYGRPSWKYAVPYDINNTPMSEDQIAPIVRDEDPDRAAWLTRAARYAEAGDQRIRVAFPASQVGVEQPALFQDAEAARRAAAQRLALYHAGAIAIEVTVRSIGYRVRLGCLVSIALPRLGLPEERTFLVVAYADAGARSTTLTLFG